MPAAAAERYFIGGDNSGHEYVVPVSRQDDWYKWTDLPEDDEASWDVPEYAIRIDGTLTFADPIVR